jgi:hypothetical protein
MKLFGNVWEKLHAKRFLKAGDLTQRRKDASEESQEEGLSSQVA